MKIQRGTEYSITVKVQDILNRDVWNVEVIDEVDPMKDTIAQALEMVMAVPGAVPGPWIVKEIRVRNYEGDKISLSPILMTSPLIKITYKNGLSLLDVPESTIEYPHSIRVDLATFEVLVVTSEHRMTELAEEILRGADSDRLFPYDVSGVVSQYINIILPGRPRFFRCSLECVEIDYKGYEEEAGQIETWVDPLRQTVQDLCDLVREYAKEGSKCTGCFYSFGGERERRMFKESPRTIRFSAIAVREEFAKKLSALRLEGLDDGLTIGEREGWFGDAGLPVHVGKFVFFFESGKEKKSERKRERE